MIADLKLGLRLAVGGGRISGSVLLRLAMTTIGIALAVAVLLPAASIGHLVDLREARSVATESISEPRAGVDPLYRYQWYLQVRDDAIKTNFVAASGPSSPVPPGLSRLPAPGELVVSPEVARLLDSPEGDALRARLPGKVVGEIGKPGLVDANDLKVYAGTTPEQLAGEERLEKIYGFGGRSSGGFMLNASLALLVTPVAVALLLPLLIFVTTASRMGAAQRDRRLAALRLIGVDARRIRRIAAAESLLGAVAGLIVGTGLFFVLRSFIGDLDLFGTRVFGEDFVPSWPWVLGIVLLVPGLAVGAAIFSLRRTIVEPLGVVRQGKPVRRRMWWRWTITALGALLMLSTLFAEKQSDNAMVMIALAAGSALLLLGVAVVLPWAVERLVRALRGGPPSWQFAVRRLQLDSGTASRVVSGLVVVLAGTILIQVMLSSLVARQDRAPHAEPRNALPVRVSTDAEHVDEVKRLVQGVPGIDRAQELRSATVKPANDPSMRSATTAHLGDCAALAMMANLPSCADGDVFFIDPDSSQSSAGLVEVPTGSMRFFTYAYREDGEAEPQPGPEWTVPAAVKHVPAAESARYSQGELLVTPAALGRIAPEPQSVSVYVGGPGTADALSDRVAAAVNGLAWHADVEPSDRYSAYRSQDDQRTERFRSVLLAASLFVLAVAALSLLMLSVEQITERRRPLAALSAAGVPLAVLARGSLWQTAIPVVVGMVLAVATGLGLTAPILRLADLPMVIDLPVVGGLAGAAVVAVLLVTALTLPLLRQVTRLDSLRAE
ncbi:FtsX-like permease family protein [Amycolatopsis anabasis]|uniref:FtsX-like permease family protein n=1 Tax=Amycolatopsis anabasis TaxID=1840409 RepID=UPI00131EB0BE|nr:FtsX-like permease family protein [Amycolatopsis anabasis]